MVESSVSSSCSILTSKVICVTLYSCKTQDEGKSDTYSRRFYHVDLPLCCQAFCELFICSMSTTYLRLSYKKVELSTVRVSCERKYEIDPYLARG